MPGLVPGIHVFDLSKRRPVDGRVKPGHDEGIWGAQSFLLLQPRHRDAVARELVGALVLVRAGMAAHPVPAPLMRFQGAVEPLPQLGILDRLLVGGAPAVLLPAM